MKSIIEFEFNEHLKTAQATLNYIAKPLEIAANLCIESLKNGGKILIFSKEVFYLIRLMAIKNLRGFHYLILSNVNTAKV